MSACVRLCSLFLLPMLPVTVLPFLFVAFLLSLLLNAPAHPAVFCGDFVRQVKCLFPCDPGTAGPAYGRPEEDHVSHLRSGLSFPAFYGAAFNRVPA